MTTLKKKIIKFFWAAWFALGFFYASVLIFNTVAPRSMIAATVLNFALIILFLLEDIVVDYLASKKKAKEQGKKQSVFTRIFLAYGNSVSFKTALYLFYIVILICSAIETVESGFFSEEFRLYLLTVEYGILVLVAVDNFLGQFFKDVSMR